MEALYQIDSSWKLSEDVVRFRPLFRADPLCLTSCRNSGFCDRSFLPHMAHFSCDALSHLEGRITTSFREASAGYELLALNHDWPKTAVAKGSHKGSSI